MPRYFFHLHNDYDVADADGTELLDLTAAREHARLEAIYMAAVSIIELQHLCGDHRIDVEDEAGEVLDSVHFRDVLEIKA